MKFNKLAKLQATLVQKLQLTDRSKILLNHIPLWTYRVAQWLSLWGRFSISYHVKDLWNFSSPQKSVVSNIAFRKRLSIKYHWCWHFSLNSILRRWTHFEAWQLLNFQYSFQFCIHDFLSGYNWFVWPNLLPSWPFVLIKRQFVSIPAISPTYFQTNWWPPKFFKNEKKMIL